jgi:dTMP kinase
MNDNLKLLKNKYIVFEGMDATGKSSVAELLVNRINDAFNADQLDFTARLTLQPGDTSYSPIATTIRSLCKDKRWNLSDYGNLFAFLLDRAENIDKVVRPALKGGQTVISDRSQYSTVAYQLYGKQLLERIKKDSGEEVGEAILKWILNPEPDVSPNIVFYFSERVGNRADDSNDLFDNEFSSFKTRVKESYESQMVYATNNVKWIRVLPGKSAEETLDLLISYLGDLNG